MTLSGLAQVSDNDLKVLLYYKINNDNNLDALLGSIQGKRVPGNLPVAMPVCSQRPYRPVQFSLIFLYFWTVRYPVA